MSSPDMKSYQQLAEATPVFGLIMRGIPIARAVEYLYANVENKISGAIKEKLHQLNRVNIYFASMATACAKLGFDYIKTNT